MFENRTVLLSCFKKSLLIACYLISIKALAYASLHDANGNEWQTWNRDQKTFYTGGFVSASNSAAISMFAAINNLPDPLGHALTRLVFDNLTVGQLVDGIDSLYLDFKNRNIPFAFAIYVVRNQIIGTPQEDIERILLWLRTGKYENKDKYLTVRDSRGVVVREINFP